MTSSAAPLAPTTHQELKTDRINEGLLPAGRAQVLTLGLRRLANPATAARPAALRRSAA